MKVFLYCQVDTGGQSARLAKALRDFEGIEAYSMAARHHVNRFPADLAFDPDKARKLFESADVVHLHNTLEVPKRLWPEPHDKPIVLHHHGTRFRTHHATIYPEARAAGVTQIVSTIDLKLLHDDTYWLPSPFDLDWLARFPNSRQGQRIRIAHSPTNRKVKSTDRIIEAVTHLHEKGLPVELDLIERVTWESALRRKASADIFVDQLHLGYGNSAIEAMAMGIPVVAGLDDRTVLEAMDATFPRPFLLATAVTLEDRLEELVERPDVRREFGLRGLQYVRRFHDQQYVANRLAGIYRIAQRKEQVA